MNKIVTYFACLFVVVCARSTNPLKFRADGTFKIVQFTDLHFGEGESTTWGPMQDINSTRVMNTILAIEQPDIVILTGDLITGNNIIDNATDYWKEMLRPMMDHRVPWAITFGNHDDLASGIGGTRKDLMKFDQSFPLSYSQFGPSNIHGVSNYWLPIYSSTDNTEITTLLYMLDSEDSNCNGIQGSGCIQQDQVTWYAETSKKISQSVGSVLPAFAFFHIPLQEYMWVWNMDVCYGTNNDSVSCQAMNTGFFAAVKERGDVQAMFVGHNHGNDFCGELDDVLLCFGRHSGYGGYGTWERGARVIEVTENPWAFQTWIRFEDGRLQPQGVKHSPTPPYQSYCS